MVNPIVKLIKLNSDKFIKSLLNCNLIISRQAFKFINELNKPLEFINLPSDLLNLLYKHKITAKGYSTPNGAIIVLKYKNNANIEDLDSFLEKFSAEVNLTDII